MAIQKKEVEFAKELDDAMFLIVELVKDIKAGKEMTVIAAENLPNLINAVSGAEQIGEEVSTSMSVAVQTVTFRVADLVAAFVAPKAV